MGTGLMWLRIGTGGGILCNVLSGFEECGKFGD
jgi:hypothetical protein